MQNTSQMIQMYHLTTIRYTYEKAPALWPGLFVININLSSILNSLFVIAVRAYRHDIKFVISRFILEPHKNSYNTFCSFFP